MDRHSRGDYCLGEGREVQGKVKGTVPRGRLIVHGERWLGRKGRGEFLNSGEGGRL